jgi:long-chain alkane monooxygenase
MSTVTSRARIGEGEGGLPKRFHLAWFTNFTAGNWSETFSHGGSPWDGKFFVEFAQAMERACFDYMILEDTLMVSEAWGGTAEMSLSQALQVPKHDPVPLAAMIAAATSRLGIVATMSTLAWPPFMLARASTTIDHIAGGRFGWNIVTSGEDAAAQNFGLDKLPPRELRYAMADEYMDLVYQLFDSWEPGAVVMDRERGVYADWRKVHPIDFEGQFFKCRGPSTPCRRRRAARPLSRPAGRRAAAPLLPSTPIRSSRQPIKSAA